jgi:pimeloyl-ACP methyl ester carboxylesterase
MSRIKKLLIGIITVPLAIVAITLATLFTIQEKRIFNFQPLAEGQAFNFETPHDHIYLKPDSESSLHGIYVKAKEPKGVIYFLHGKGSNLSWSKWNKVSKQLTAYGYDVFMIDYRGFGKSEGPLSEAGLLSDIQTGYDFLKTKYPESQITVYGKSLGTSFATYAASKNNPKRLILEAPFYNLVDVAGSTLPFIPKFMIATVLKYPLKTNEWITEVSCPVYFFHGTKDEIIPHDSSIRLHEIAKTVTESEIIILEDIDHDTINLQPSYSEKMELILKN